MGDEEATVSDTRTDEERWLATLRARRAAGAYAVATLEDVERLLAERDEALRKGLAAAQEKHDAMRAAEAQLAVLRDAVLAHDDAETLLYAAESTGSSDRELVLLRDRAIAADTAKSGALADTAAAAEAYTRRVEAKALRKAAEMCEASAGHTTSKYRPRTLDDERASAAHLHDAKMLRARADEIEGGQ